MSKTHIETTRVSNLVESLCDTHHHETHRCDDGMGENAVTGYGDTPRESREDAADKSAAKKASGR